jgi:hypothetical protein
MRRVLPAFSQSEMSSFWDITFAGGLMYRQILFSVVDCHHRARGNVVFHHEHRCNRVNIKNKARNRHRTSYLIILYNHLIPLALPSPRIVILSAGGGPTLTADIAKVRMSLQNCCRPRRCEVSPSPQSVAGGWISQRTMASQDPVSTRSTSLPRTQTARTSALQALRLFCSHHRKPNEW